jgi:hypothetical protein
MRQLGVGSREVVADDLIPTGDGCGKQKNVLSQDIVGALREPAQMLWSGVLGRVSIE